MEYAIARERHEASPATFDIPDQQMLDDLTVDDYIQVILEDEGSPGERFWAKIQRIQGERIIAAVANNLLFFPLQPGDLITVKFENVINTRPWYRDELDGILKELADACGVSVERLTVMKRSGQLPDLNPSQLQEFLVVNKKMEDLNERIERHRAEHPRG